MKGESVQVIFGLKLRQYREERGLLLREFAQKAGLSVSYLNEIEKGKKYPKTEKIMQLANALEISYDELVSLKLDQELNPLEDLLESEVFQELPLQLFGIAPHDVIELMTRAPIEASALIRTLVEIARSYDMQVEYFFHAMLRSYQEAHDNYFGDLEEAARETRQELGWGSSPLTYSQVATYLGEAFGYQINTETIANESLFHNFRSIFVEGTPPQVLLNPNLGEDQQTFQLCRELAYLRLGLKERGLTSSRTEAASFEQVLNDFKASYFAGALLMEEASVVKDLEGVFGRKRWMPQALQSVMEKYGVTPETFLYRLSQLVPTHFGLRQLHFLRFTTSEANPEYRLTKQFNMSHVPIPTGIGLHEHYCRRWLSVEMLDESETRRKENRYETPLLGIQRSRFMDREAEFLCFTLARPLSLTPTGSSSVTLGFRVDDHVKERIGFCDDGKIPQQELNETCERCNLPEGACDLREAPPSIYLQQQAKQQRKERLHQLSQPTENPS